MKLKTLVMLLVLTLFAPFPATISGKEVLRDRWGKAIGRLEDKGREIILRDRLGKKLGSYDKRTNTTRDRWGRVIGKGNLLTMLLCDNKKLGKR